LPGVLGSQRDSYFVSAALNVEGKTAMNAYQNNVPHGQVTSDLPHFRLDNHGSIALLIPLTNAGREWLESNVNPEPWQWFGPGLAVEPRYLGALLNGALDDGLEVEA
jgi:hypothetical protein